MKIKINQASPVLHKSRDYKFSVKLWNVSGKVIPDCNCSALAKDFDTYIDYPVLDGNMNEVYKLTQNKLKTDGEIV